MAASGGNDGSSGGDGGGGGSGEELPLRERAKWLNELFYSSEAPPGISDLESLAEEPPSSYRSPAARSARLLPDLPLWRVQWAALPGHQEVLHVHVPHYTTMMERLFRQPRPWRFGHVYLPEGSKNLGNEEYALMPGSKAPLTGTLMEVLQVCRFGDGRLIILAVGVSRFRVLRPTQDLPYSRADVELMCDLEEQQLMEPLALQALESVQASSGEGQLQLTSLMSVLPTAAREAAAAYAQCWLEYELSDVRLEEDAHHIIDGTRTNDAQLLGRRLAAIAGNEVLQMPFFDAVTSAVRADALAAAMDAAAAAEGEPAGGDAAAAEGAAAADNVPGGSGRALQAALEAQRPVLRQTEAAAYAQASSAAVSCIAQQLEQQEGGGSGGSDSSSSTSSAAAAADLAAAELAPPVLNLASERGVQVQAPEEVLGEDSLEGEPDSLAVALQLEAAVWAEIDAVQALGTKLRSRPSPLPEGVQCLRPPSLAGTPAAAALAAEPESAAGAGGGKERPVAPPDFPALRRTLRLSYACAALLATVSATEGRQAWVEAGSICARLRLGLASLRKQRQVLAAVVAVEGL